MIHSDVATVAAGAPPAPSPRSGKALATIPTLPTLRIWDLRAVSKRSNFSGLAAMGRRGIRRRRICVEVRRVRSSFPGSAADTDADANAEAECIVRIMTPSDIFRKLSRRATKKKSDRHGDDDGGDDEDDDDDESSDDESEDSPAERKADGDGREPSTTRLPAGVDRESDRTADRSGVVWRTKYKFNLTSFRAARPSDSVIVAGGESLSYSIRATKKMTLQIAFQSNDEATKFYEEIERQRAALDERERVHLKRALGDIALTRGEQLRFVIDIVSASDMPRADVGKDNDTYVSVKFQGQKVHRTLHVWNTADPVWTLRHHSLFYWEVDALELFQSRDGLVFHVKDFDTLGYNDSLGSAVVPARALYLWEGERKEFRLKATMSGTGALALRVRRATDTDWKFAAEYPLKVHDDARHDDSFDGLGLGDRRGSIMERMESKMKNIVKNGETAGAIVRRKSKDGPGPDPILEEAMGESTNWIEVGSGTLGKVFVEIIGCSDLPNMDVGGAFGNFTDAFVCLVYEDGVAQTDVIDDSLSPRWDSSSQRAFVLRMTGTSSPLYVGVFDYDVGSNHDLVGRVSVNLANLRPDTVYLLHYTLHLTGKLPPRKSRGTITLRIRMELASERTLLLSNLEVPPYTYVNVKKRQDIKMVRQTVEGSVKMTKFDQNLINSYCEELVSYFFVIYYIEDAFKSLIFWRGHFRMTLPFPEKSSTVIRWSPVDVPLNSATAFIFAALLVEHPNLMPSFFFGTLCWLMLATMGSRANATNPWYRCKSFKYYLVGLIFGKRVAGPQTIAEWENVSESLKNAEDWKKRIEQTKKQAVEKALQYEIAQKEYEREMDELRTSAQAKARKGKTIIDPTRRYLFPIQRFLGVIVRGLRVIQNVFCWDECYVSFWLTVINFVLAFICYFVPWGFIVKWSLRIVVWTVLGPWMRLVDIYYFSKEWSEAEIESHKLRKNTTKQSLLAKYRDKVRIRREKVEKMEDMRRYMFGKYSQNVNPHKLDRYRDTPLKESFATCYNQKSYTLGSLAMQEAGYHRILVKGQTLVGDMIPKRIEAPLTVAPTGKPAMHTSLLAKGDLGAIYVGNDSYIAAVFKIGSIVMSAGAITVFGIPMMVCIFHWIFQDWHLFGVR